MHEERVVPWVRQDPLLGCSRGQVMVVAWLVRAPKGGSVVAPCVGYLLDR